VSFPDGALILRSWVGTSAIGRPHTGCPRYEVASHYVRELYAHHRHYLSLETERGKLETACARFERQDRWSKRDEEAYARLLGRYQESVQHQAALQAATLLTAQRAPAVNE
jgi:hypothetical protein